MARLRKQADGSWLDLAPPSSGGGAPTTPAVGNTIENVIYDLAWLTIDFAGHTTAYQHFFNQPRLRVPPKLINTGQITSTEAMFRACTVLTSAPQMDASKVTNTSFMFFSCTALTSVPMMDTSKVTNAVGMFRSCSNLTETPPLDLGSCTSLSDFVLSCTKLAKLPVKNVRVSLNVSGTALEAAALNELFSGLAPVTTTQTVTITGTPGAATCDRSIATSKGWTVTG